MKILIAEDDVNSRVFLERALLSQGYTVESAANGVQALEKATLSPPDLIISDIMMPEMDGFELCRRVKTNELLQTIPFVFYTATYIDQKDENLAMALGASRFLIKPMEPKKFLSTISELLEENRSGHTPVPGSLPGEISELDRMRAEIYSRKLDKKVRELEEERAALRRANEELRKLSRAVEQSPVSVIITGLNGDIEYVNPKFTEVTGYRPEEVLGKKPSILKSGETLPDEYRKLWESITSGGEWHGVFHNKRKDGTLFWERASISPVRDTSGIVTHFIAVKEDITDQKSLEDQLRQAQKMEAVGQLAGGIAHDFNNILTAMIGYGHMLQIKLKENETLRTYADHILSLSEMASNLTQSLLAFSRKQVMNPGPLNLNELIRRVEKFLFRIIGEDIQLKTDLSEKDLIIMADHVQIEQVLMNLSTNARDAMPKGGRLIIETDTVDIDHEFIREHGYGTEGLFAVISVTDSGEGMDRETREKIFQPFFTTKEAGKGTGLGLSMVYGIIKQHGGYINVYSEPGKGTTFRIYLPLIDAKADEIKPDVIKPIETGTETILLAEDETEVREFTKKLLEEYGYRIIETADGDDAIEKFKLHKDKIQLAMLDVIMPNRNGREVYEAIRKLRPDIKVLFTSGYPADHIDGIIEKGSAFILKPVSPTKLLQKIREVLGE